MHTVHVSHLRAALQDYFQDDEEDDLLLNKSDLTPEHDLDPHAFEHQSRAAELIADDDEDAAIIHQLLGTNMMRAARDSN